MVQIMRGLARWKPASFTLPSASLHLILIFPSAELKAVGRHKAVPVQAFAPQTCGMAECGRLGRGLPACRSYFRTRVSSFRPGSPPPPG